MRAEISSVKELPEIHLLGHTCTNLNGDLLFVWGGSNEAVAFSQSPNTGLWIYETLTGYWRYKVCTGDCPPYLSSSSSCLIGQKMYIFGGHSTVQDNWLNCLYCLDLDTFIWRDVGSQASAEPTKPIRSDKNVCWSYDKKLYIFGGYGWSQVEHYSELLDCQKDLQLTPDFRWPKFGWNNQLVEYNPSDKTWRWPNYRGKCPSARAAHSGALMGDKYFVFGGRDSQERLNDLYTFDMRTLEWQQVAVVASDALGFRMLMGNRQGAPIGHLGDRNIESTQAEEDHMDPLADENHRQLVEEMHDVQLDDDEDRWNPVPSSSSIHSDIDEQSDISTENEDNREDTQTGDFEYPGLSHLMKRWSSLSSTDEQRTLDQGGDTSGSHDVNCLFETQPRIQEAGTAAGSQISHQAQNLMLRNDSLTDHPPEQSPAIVAAAAAAAAAAATAPRALAAPSQQRDQIHYQDPDRQQPHLQALADDHIADGAQDNERPDNTNSPKLSIPTGRSFCSLTPISSTDMLLFGGVDSHDQNLDDCWLFNISTNHWSQINDFKHKRPRLWHTGARTKQNEVVIMGGSSSDKIDEFCSDVLLLSFEAKSLKRLALDAVSRSVRMKTIQRTKGLPSTLIKLIKLRKQAMALTIRRSGSQRSLPVLSASINDN